jgi:hypothetical protein
VYPLALHLPSKEPLQLSDQSLCKISIGSVSLNWQDGVVLSSTSF